MTQNSGGAPDTSKWREEVDGKPLEVVSAFLEWLDRLPAEVEDGKRIVTAASWSRFREQVADDSVRQHLAVQLAHRSTTVRYPADGMAYVMSPLLHPDQDESITFAETTTIYSKVITLLMEDGEWRIQRIGQLVAPTDVGKTAYSW